MRKFDTRSKRDDPIIAFLRKQQSEREESPPGMTKQQEECVELAQRCLKAAQVPTAERRALLDEASLRAMFAAWEIPWDPWLATAVEVELKKTVFKESGDK